jgi:exopolysaccharide biosynthesis polyprenyl glycosylphosphotransferase
MSVDSQARGLDEGRHHLRGIVEPLVRGVARLARFGGNAQWLVVAGRAALIWLPVFTLMANQLSWPTAVVTTSLVTAVWMLALRAALSTYFTLGPAVVSAVGTVTGLVAVSALDLWMPGISLDALKLGETAFAVFVLSAAWEHVVRIVAKRRVLIVGANGVATAVMNELARAEHTPFTIVGVVDDPDPEDASGTTPLGSIPDLSLIVEAQRPDIVILTDEQSSASALDRLLSRAPIDFKVVSIPHFFEHAFGRVPLGYLTPAWFMSILHLRQKTYPRVAKRAFDLVVAAFGLLLVAPLAPLLAALVRTTPGPTLYRQTRLGEGGKRFTMYKLRTMRQDAEDSEHPLFAEESDPRVTRVGRFLRKTHLDETPQLWNVLRGDMSMVGPRPERPEFITMLEGAVPFWTRRLLVKPGITGWAQLRCGYAYDSESTAAKLSYDLWYLRNRNVVVDLAICAKTFAALVLRSGR